MTFIRGERFVRRSAPPACLYGTEKSGAVLWFGDRLRFFLGVFRLPLDLRDGRRVVARLRVGGFWALHAFFRHLRLTCLCQVSVSPGALFIQDGKNT